MESTGRGAAEREPSMEGGGVYLGDARDLATWLSAVAPNPEPVITTTITSPPYGDLKDYGQPNQIGWAQPYEQYLLDCRSVLTTLFDRTHDDGSLWLVADTLRLPKDSTGLWHLEPLPFHLAEEAAKAGWILRDVAIWRKDRSVPWSGRGRMRNVFEYILQFVKGGQFKYHIDRIRNPSRLEEWWVRFPERYHPGGKVPANVWDIPIPRQGSWAPTIPAKHSCPLPGELVERIVLLSTDPDDLVFDPFAGIGSVVAHAQRLGRRGLGLESNQEFIDAYWSHLRPEETAKAPTLSDQQRADAADELADKLVKLRVLKFPRALFEVARDSVHKAQLPEPLTLAVISNGRRRRETPTNGVWAAVEVVAAVDADEETRDAVEELLMQAATKRPVSKFGIAASIQVVPPRQFAATLGQRQRLHYYLRGHTWKCHGTVSPGDAIRLGREYHEGTQRSVPPITSNLHISEDPRPIG